MAQENRVNAVRDYIQTIGEVTFQDLDVFYKKYSSMTMYRDLKRLEEEGYIRRIHGGAISMNDVVLPRIEGIYSKRARENMTEKTAIAKAALRYIGPRQALYLDAGSTVMALANMLGEDHYTILTSGTNIAIELSQRSTCDVLLVGGQVSANNLSCSGSQAETLVENVNFDIAIMATSGYKQSSGFTCGSQSEGLLKRKAISKADKVIMLMDNSKVGRVLPFSFAVPKDIDVIICNKGLDKNNISAFKEARVKLLEV